LCSTRQLERSGNCLYRFNFRRNGSLYIGTE